MSGQVASASTTGPLTAIVAAMRAEIAPLLARVQVTRRERNGGCRMVAGRLGSARVVLAWTGEGRLHAAAGARAVLDRFPVDRLLVLGVAGGLSPDLEPGSLLLARRIVDGSGASHEADPTWFEEGLRAGQARSGTVLTSERILCSPDAKALARQQLASEEPATVDLESAAFAAVAAERGVDWLVVRAVSDTADEALPIDFNGCLDPAGRVRRLRVVGQALRQPGAVRTLWGLRQRVRLCAEELARFSERLLCGESA